MPNERLGERLPERLQAQSIQVEDHLMPQHYGRSADGIRRCQMIKQRRDRIPVEHLVRPVGRPAGGRRAVETRPVEREVGEQQDIARFEGGQLARVGGGICRERSIWCDRQKAVLPPVTQESQVVRGWAQLDAAVGRINVDEWRPSCEEPLGCLAFEQILHAEEGVILMPWETGTGRARQLATAIVARGDDGLPVVRQYTNEGAQGRIAEEQLLEDKGRARLCHPRARCPLWRVVVRGSNALLEWQPRTHVA